MTLRILLVSGDEAAHPPMAEALRQVLWEDGAAEIASAESGEQAVALAAEEPFDLAVADLVLPRPGLSGATTLIRVRELCPRCRTILTSDHGYARQLTVVASDHFLVRERSTKAPGATQLAAAARALLPDRLGDEQATRPFKIESLATGETQPETRVEGRYRLFERLGRRRGGRVYRAEDTVLDRPVALKLFALQSPGEADIERQIRRGLKQAERLRHDGIVAVHAAGIDGSDLYVATELVEGRRLREVLREHRALARGEAIDIALQVLKALSHGHDLGVTHGDLKPGNVFLAAGGGVKVADLGFTTLIPLTLTERPDVSTRVAPSTDGAVLSTVGYMAPEQIQGRSVDHRADLYALGAMLFEMLHGKALSRVVSPFVRAAFLDMNRPPQPLPVLAGERALSRVIEHALAPSLERRYESCQAFRDELLAARRSGWRRFNPWAWG